MATVSGRTAKRMKEKPAAPTWHDLARLTDQKRARWARSTNGTSWVACGTRWDAVAIAPMETGLTALTGLRIGTRRDRLVLVDHLRDVLYVMVPPGSGAVCDGIAGVRVLSRGHQLLMPTTYGDSTAAADLISHPRDGEPPALVPADRLAARLRELAAHTPETAAVS
ncbi:hypothetical protein [Streptomyces sp. NPDC093109]|uniref:hypothetical protein n=1 Tax=Streptomyces sp. NPDC093109 TaxID=3154977 RepID=UPI00344DC75E